MEATWRTVQTDGSTDLDLTSSRRGVVRGKEAVAARVAIALGTRLGDWFGDLGAGVDEALVRGRLAFLGEAEREFARVAQAQSGVQSVTVSRVSYDPRTRDGEYSVEIELDPANGGGSVVVAAALSS